MDPAAMQAAIQHMAEQLQQQQIAGLQQMQQQLQEQQAQAMQALQQQLAGAMASAGPPLVAAVQAAQAAQLAAAAAAAPHAARPDRPRLAPPAKYAGSSAALDEWLNEMARQFDFYIMVGDAERIRYATVNMEGAAWDWWTNLTVRPPTWALMETALRGRFQPVNSAELTRARMLTLTQGKQNVHEYVDAFRRLLVHVPSMSEEDRLFQFLRGLRQSIATQIRVLGVTVLETAIATAVRVGTLHDLGSGLGAPGGAPSGHAAAHAPMELDAIEGLEAETTDEGEDGAPVTITRAQLHHMLNAMRDSRSAGAGRGGTAAANRGGGGRSFGARGLPTIPGMTAAQVKEYMDDGKCFTCGSKDHRSRQCPKNKGNAAGAGSGRPAN